MAFEYLILILILDSIVCILYTSEIDIAIASRILLLSRRVYTVRIFIQIIIRLCCTTECYRIRIISRNRTFI